MLRALSCGLLFVIPACVSWSAPTIIPIRGSIPRQILILPVSKSAMGPQFAAELDAYAGVEIERRGYQSLRPGIADTLLSSRGWISGQSELPSLPFAALRDDHEVDAVLATELADWQADVGGGRYRYRVFWTLYDCESGEEIWRYDDGGQVRPERQIGNPRILYDEDVAHGPGPKSEAYGSDRITSQELARLLQRAAALRLPYGPEHPDHGWTVRKK